MPPKKDDPVTMLQVYIVTNNIDDKTYSDSNDKIFVDKYDAFEFGLQRAVNELRRYVLEDFYDNEEEYDKREKEETNSEKEEDKDFKYEYFKNNSDAGDLLEKIDEILEKEDYDGILEMYQISKKNNEHFRFYTRSHNYIDIEKCNIDITLYTKKNRVKFLYVVENIYGYGHRNIFFDMNKALEYGCQSAINALNSYLKEENKDKEENEDLGVEEVYKCIKDIQTCIDNNNYDRFMSYTYTYDNFFADISLFDEEDSFQVRKYKIEY